MLNTINNNPVQTSWQLAQASIDSLTQAIQSGRSEALFTYLQTMAKFPTYSARNVLLIAAQRPDATHLEGVRSWNDLGRSVRPGEKGIRIFAPTVVIKPESQAQEDSKTAFSDCQLYYGDSRLLSESLAVVHRTAAVILGAISPEIAAPANSKQGVN